MYNFLIQARNAITKFFYKNLFKKVFFNWDPEDAHDRMTAVGKLLGRFWITRKFISILFNFSDPSLEQNIQGIHFKNPIGLSAGFDKNAQLVDILPSVGFGFAELGSITGEPCKGNPRPRLWRLKESDALLVYYGLKNDGCEKISHKLKNKKFAIPYGISIAKTNSADTCELQAGIGDYVKAFKHFIDIGHYVTINISCPNTFGGEPFTDQVKLDHLLGAIDKISYQKPIFLKLSADLSHEQIDAILEVVSKHRVDGLVCTNLTKKRDNSKIKEKEIPTVGGISGKVVDDLSTEMIKYVYRKTKGKYLIIGSGGVFSAEDAYKKIKAGASLIQLITGMIFEGPQLISEINRGLVKLLKKDGYKNIHEAIGTDSKK